MKTVKIVLALVLTLVLLMLGAALPQVVSGIQNRNQMDPGFREVQTVNLELDPPLTLMDKLYVFGNGSFYPNPENLVLTEELLRDAVKTGLNPYYYRDLVPYNWVDVSFEATPYVIYRADEPEINYAIWIVTLGAEDWHVEVDVDDETGLPLRVMYTNPGKQEVWSPKGYTEQLKEAWFESLGLAEDLWWNTPASETDGNTTSILCRYTDENGRSVGMEFTTHPYGFWIFEMD